MCALVLAYHRHILAPHTNICPLLNIPAKVIIIIQLKSGNGPVIEIALVLGYTGYSTVIRPGRIFEIVNCRQNLNKREGKSPKWK